jgi:glyoxylase-like metal-dependent hydrolase (beta-lactamase superfamily II)
MGDIEMASSVVNVGYDSTNYYVIAGSHSAGLLVDCGWPGTMGKLKNQLRRKGIEFKGVKYLLVTHYHPDHAGLTQELRNLGMHLILLDTQVPFVQLLKTHMKPDSGYVEIEVAGTHILVPEDSRAYLDRIGIEGEIIPTPGHSPDSVSLILDDGIAFTGDLTHELLLPDDETTCRESWRRVFAHGVTRVYPAHGRTQNRRNFVKGDGL